MHFTNIINKDIDNEFGEVQISLHKIVHVDWLRFCALRNKTDDERKGNAGGSGKAVEEKTEEGRQLAKHLIALARQFSFRRCYSDCLSWQDRDSFYKVLFCGFDRRCRVMFLVC